MKCLITGICGFVGSHLAEYLLHQGQEVYGTIYPGEPQQNIKHICNKITSISCDLTIKTEVEKAIQITKPDKIFHLAGQAHPPSSWTDPLATFKINVFAPIYLIDAIKNLHPSAQLLIIGSGDEYGDVDNNKKITETAPLNPQTPYAITKICTDLLSGQLATYHNLHIVRVRPFPHIGPRQKSNFVVADFSRQIALIETGKQNPIMKVGNLESKRDFTDVRDIACAYWLALEKGKSGDVYNISSEKILSIKDILKKLISLSNANIQIQIESTKIRTVDTHIKQGNSQKFRTQTGWQPKISIEKTIEDTLNWWRKNVKGEQHISL